MPKIKNGSETVKEEEKRWKRKHYNGAGGALYGLGFIGVVIYYLQHATTFGITILGILKAIVWPAILAYNLFSFLKL